MVNTFTDYAVFMLLTKIFSVPLERVWLAKLVSGGLAMTVSFLLNCGWVFASQDARRSGQVGRFLVTTISASWGIQLGLTQFFSSVWPAPGLAAFAALRSLGQASTSRTRVGARILSFRAAGAKARILWSLIPPGRSRASCW